MSLRPDPQEKSPRVRGRPPKVYRVLLKRGQGGEESGGGSVFRCPVGVISLMKRVVREEFRSGRVNIPFSCFSVMRKSCFEDSKPVGDTFIICANPFSRIVYLIEVDRELKLHNYNSRVVRTTITIDTSFQTSS